MHTALYVIWFLLPFTFVLLALWAKLEQLSKSPKKQNPGDFLKQGFFVLICVLISVALDQYLLLPNTESFPWWLPLGVVQVLLLPAVLSLAARLFGASKAVRITRSPRPSSTSRGKR